MVACGECGASDQFLYHCESCETPYCHDHLAPEAHLCEAAPVETNVFAAEPDPSAASETGAAHAAAGDPASSDREPGPTERRYSFPSTMVAVGLVAVLVVLSAGVGFAVTGPDLDADLLPGFGRLAGLEAGDGGSAGEAVNATAVEQRMADQLNDLRTERGRAPVSYDAELAAIAAYHSTDMAERNYTGHVAPDGETVRDRFDAFGYECAAPGELVLYTAFGRDIETANGTLRFESEADLGSGIIELWMQSAPHRAALLSDTWEAIGAGVVVTPAGDVHVTLTTC